MTGPGRDLRLLHAPAGRVDASAIRADAIAGQPIDAVRGLALQVDDGGRRRSVSLGELFDVEALASSGDVRIVGDVPNFDRLAAGQRSGRLEVLGDAGDLCGYRMRRGELFVRGSAGRFLGAHATAGTILIGARVGAEPGLGMRRGTLLATAETIRPEIPLPGYGEAVLVDFPWARLLRGGSNGWTDILLSQMLAAGVRVRRGDRSVGGQAEIAVPAA